MTKLWVVFAALGVMSGLGACTNISQFAKNLSTINASSTTSLVNYSHILNNVVASTPSPNGTVVAEIDLGVDTSQANFIPLTSFCSVGGTNPCDCDLKWTEVNTVGGGNQSISRENKLAATEVQSGVVKCQMPLSTWQEIVDGTVITMNIVPVTPTNVTPLSVRPIGYKKGTSTSTNGDFLDSTLTPFRNIYRYTCFTSRSSSYEILNQFISTTTPSGSTDNVTMGSQFCSGVIGNSSAGQCSNPRYGPSAQSYYRNLYVRTDWLGHINSSTSTSTDATGITYDCPEVVEPILYSANSSIPTTVKNQYWPLDSQFALAATYSPDWSVGVHAGSVLYKAGDAYSDPTQLSSDVRSCQDETAGVLGTRLSERGITIKCLGYAKIPNNDGTCGTITDSNNRVRYMVRLRRYRALYPAVFASNGSVPSGANEADEIYVPDRLVVNSQGVPNGDEIYGPKPCNFAWFDHEGVVKRNGSLDFQSNLPGDAAGEFARPSYVATSNYKYVNQLTPSRNWSVNPDGLIFPNIDSNGTNGTVVAPSCSSTIPVVEFSLGAPSYVRLLTLNRSRTDKITIGAKDFYLQELAVRPIEPWTPNYVEDISFKACVPLSDTFTEPPLHIFKDANEGMAWCSKAYPTQNPDWTALNLKKKAVQSGLPNTLVNYATGMAAPAGTPYFQVYNFTSHNLALSGQPLDPTNTNVANVLDSLAVNQSCSGTKNTDICTATLGSASATDCDTYLQTDIGGYVRKTCDRTVVYDPTRANTIFPLQAADADVGAMLAGDLAGNKNFTCNYSVSSDSSKVNAKKPSSGCCGVANGTALLAPILNQVGIPSQGHLEPYGTAGGTSRFCGNPVQ